MAPTKTPTRKEPTRKLNAAPIPRNPGEAPAPRVLVHSVDERVKREYAPPVFDGSRQRTAEDAQSEIREVEGEPTAEAEVVMADRQTGGAIVMESDVVLTRAGRAVSRAAAPTRARPTRPGAQWMGASGGREQDVVMNAPAESAVDPEAVAAGDLIRRTEQAGPAEPTGQPCTCAFTWERNEETGQIDVWYLDGAGVPTGFRGAPRWMTWCIVCGGERDGLFRPENPVRYGSQVLAPEPQADPEAIVQEAVRRMGASQRPAAEALDEEALTRRVSESVMNDVAETLSNDKFLDLLAEKLAGKVKAKS